MLSTASEGLKGSVAVVTGSTRGIGLAIASELASHGCKVVVNGSSSEEAVRDVVKRLPGGSDRHLGIRADVSILDDVKSLAEEVDRKYGRCDILVNNAGWTRFVGHSDLRTLDEDTFDRIMGVNLFGVFACIQQFLELLRASSQASVVNVASIAATSAMGSNVAYCASKAAVVNLTRSLARALAPEIKVNSVSPGLVDTELTRGWEEYRSEQIRQTPMGRLCGESDVANAVIALVALLDFVTGQDLIVDGGRLLGSR